jgi:DNA-binding GntR family transcriptional regulator
MAVIRLKTRKTNNSSLSDQAYHLVKQQILSNRLPGGYHVLEEELALRLKMSRTPLREALVRLQNEGLLQLIPRHGLRIVPLSIDDVQEIYQVLACLETTAAELLAAKKPNGKEVALLQAAVDQMRAALTEDDLNSWAEADERFHRALVDQCGNTRLANAARTFLDQSQRVRIVTLRLRERPVRSTQYHAELVDAIRAGNGKLARKVHTQQKDTLRNDMLKLMEECNIHQF